MKIKITQRANKSNKISEIHTYVKNKFKWKWLETIMDINQKAIPIRCYVSLSSAKQVCWVLHKSIRCFISVAGAILVCQVLLKCGRCYISVSGAVCVSGAI